MTNFFDSFWGPTLTPPDAEYPLDLTTDYQPPLVVGSYPAARVSRPKPVRVREEDEGPIYDHSEDESTLTEPVRLVREVERRMRQNAPFRERHARRRPPRAANDVEPAPRAAQTLYG